MPQPPPTGWPAYGIVITMSDCARAGAFTFVYDSNVDAYRYSPLDWNITPPFSPPGPSVFDTVGFVLSDGDDELDGEFNLEDEGNTVFVNETVTFTSGGFEGASFSVTVATRPPPPPGRLSIGIGLGI